MVPEVFVSDELKRARRIALAMADDVCVETGCHVFCVVAECDGVRIRTALAEDSKLESDVNREALVLRSTLCRVVSLLVLQMGRGDALGAVLTGYKEGVRLALEAHDRNSATG